jgi:hypothetical protein
LLDEATSIQVADGLDDAVEFLLPVSPLPPSRQSTAKLA